MPVYLKKQKEGGEWRSDFFFFTKSYCHTLLTTFCILLSTIFTSHYFLSLLEQKVILLNHFFSKKKHNTDTETCRCLPIQNTKAMFWHRKALEDALSETTLRKNWILIN